MEEPLESESYLHFKDRIGEVTIFKCKYAKNGRIGSKFSSTALLQNINEYKKDETFEIDHLWISDKSFAKKVKRYQGKEILVLAKIVEVLKPFKLYQDKKTITLDIKEVYVQI